MLGIGGHGLPSALTGLTIDNTIIGGTTPAAGTFTTLTATGAFTSLGIDDNATGEVLQLSGTTGTHPIGIGVVSDSTTSGLISFNNAYAASTASGISGGADSNLYYRVPTGGEHYITVAGGIKVTTSATLVTLASAMGLTLTDGDVTLSEGKLTITDTANEVALTVTSSATTQDAVFINVAGLTQGAALLVRGNALTTGKVAEFSSTSSDTGAFTILNLINDSASATGAYCVRMQQDAANAFMNLVGTAAANTTDPISTLTTPGAIVGFEQVDVNGTKRWRALYADPS